MALLGVRVLKFLRFLARFLTRFLARFLTRVLGNGKNKKYSVQFYRTLGKNIGKVQEIYGIDGLDFLS